MLWTNLDKAPSNVTLKFQTLITWLDCQHRNFPRNSRKYVYVTFDDLAKDYNFQQLRTNVSRCAYQKRNKLRLTISGEKVGRWVVGLGRSVGGISSAARTSGITDGIFVGWYTTMHSLIHFFYKMKHNFSQMSASQPFSNVSITTFLLTQNICFCHKRFFMKICLRLPLAAILGRMSKKFHLFT